MVHLLAFHWSECITCLAKRVSETFSFWKHKTTKSNTCQTINTYPNATQKWWIEGNIQNTWYKRWVLLLCRNVCKGFLCQNNMLDYGVTFIHSNFTYKHAKTCFFYKSRFRMFYLFVLPISDDMLARPLFHMFVSAVFYLHAQPFFAMPAVYFLQFI